ncbi:MAG: stage II sporulation protein P [Bacillota bacterium]|jgi:stage II sporulation protein P
MSNRRLGPTLKITALPFWFTYGALGLFFAVMGVIGVLALNTVQQRLFCAGRLTRETKGSIRLNTQSCRFILCNGLPFLEQAAGEEDPFRLIEFDWSGIYWKLAVNIRHTNSREILKNQLPLLELVKTPLKPIVPAIPLDSNISKTGPPPGPPPMPAAPQILIYHTHTSESYIPVSGQAHLLNQRGDIVKVGARLQKNLETKYHIRTLHCNTIHDQPPFKESYERSQITVKQYLKKYPSLKVLIDLHRDATPGLNAVCTVKGQKTATILAVVGTDKMLPHPNWKKNQEFACLILDRVNLYYPGLSNGLITSKGRYNQHLHSHALLIEVGDQYSTLEEAYNAVDAFAELLTLTFKETRLLAD